MDALWLDNLSGLILLIFRPGGLFRVCGGTITVASLSAFFHTFRAGHDLREMGKLSVLTFWLAFIVCWDLFAKSSLDQFPLSNIMTLFMTGYLTLMNCRSLLYQEFGPFLSSTLTQLYHCHAWDWIKSLLRLCEAAISKWGNIYFLFTLICFSGFSTMHSF